MYLVIVKGKKLAFFEYHCDRTNLYEEGVLNTKGAIPFHHVQNYASDSQDLHGRPPYSGSGSLGVDFEEGGETTSSYARCISTFGY